MKIRTSHHGIVEIDADSEAVYSLRHLKCVAPNIRLYATTEEGRRRFIIPICDFEFDHQILAMLNAEMVA